MNITEYIVVIVISILALEYTYRMFVYEKRRAKLMNDLHIGDSIKYTYIQAGQLMERTGTVMAITDNHILTDTDRWINRASIHPPIPETLIMFIFSQKKL